MLLYGLNVKLTALAYPSELVEKSNVSTFTFLEEYEYKIKEVKGLFINEHMTIQKGNKYSSYEIDSYKNISTNELDVDCMEAIDMRRFLDGDSAIGIDYKGIYSGAEYIDNEILGQSDDSLGSGDDLLGSREEVLDKFIKIGVITLYAVNEEPYFRLSNYEASVGIGTKNFIIPSKVYELIPIEINDFNVYSYIRHVNNNYIEGSIIIKRQEISGSLLDKIALKDLNLSKDQVSIINGKNAGYSTLEIVKNYVFTIPLDLILEEKGFKLEHREEGYDTSITVELPLRFQASVTHK